MTLTRKHGYLLLASALWLVVVWSRFIVTLATDHHQSAGFYIAHSVLIAVDFAIAALLAVWGVRALRR